MMMMMMMMIIIIIINLNLVHCRTKSLHSSLWDASFFPGYSNKTYLPISVSSVLSVLPAYCFRGLSFLYSNYPAIISSSHEVSCPCQLYFCFNCTQDVFNISLLPNQWCSLPILSCYIKHCSFHSSLGTLKFSFQGFRKTQSCRC